MRAKAILMGCVLAMATLPGPVAAEDWKDNAKRMDAAMKAFDARQALTMPDQCTAEYAIVAPNRGGVPTHRKINLKLVNGESIENGYSANYTIPFNYGQVSFDCHRGNGQPNCINDSVTFGYMAVKPGAEPAFCKLLISAIATCQGVATFKSSKRGCELPEWEKEFVKNGPSKKTPSRLGM